MKKGAELSRRFIYADHFKPADPGPGGCGLEFTRSLDDGAGARWDCRFSFVLSNDDRVKVVYEATPDKDGWLVHFQGPTLHVGEGTFGARKDDGLFCGLEWLVGDEASSSNLDMHDPDYYVRFVPHPNKITVPLMAFSKEQRRPGALLGLPAEVGRDQRPARGGFCLAEFHRRAGESPDGTVSAVRARLGKFQCARSRRCSVSFQAASALAPRGLDCGCDPGPAIAGLSAAVV